MIDEVLLNRIMLYYRCKTHQEHKGKAEQVQNILSQMQAWFNQSQKHGTKSQMHMYQAFYRCTKIEAQHVIYAQQMQRQNV